MMKTRIKISMLNNGDAVYYPQYKGWIFWKHFEESRGYDYTDRIKFDSLGECKSFIDEQLEKEAIRKGKQPNRTFYVKYP